MVDEDKAFTFFNLTICPTYWMVWTTLSRYKSGLVSKLVFATKLSSVTTTDLLLSSWSRIQFLLFWMLWGRWSHQTWNELLFHSYYWFLSYLSLLSLITIWWSRCYCLHWAIEKWESERFTCSRHTALGSCRARRRLGFLPACSNGLFLPNFSYVFLNRWIPTCHVSPAEAFAKILLPCLCLMTHFSLILLDYLTSFPSFNSARGMWT